MKNKSIFLLTFLLMTIICRAQDSTSDWNEKRQIQHLKNRQDSTIWDLELLQRDIDENKQNGIVGPIAHGAFPVPKYALLGKESFKGIGTWGNSAGIDFNGKKIVYGNFFANNNAIIKKFIGNKTNEVFFTIVVLTDFIDTINYTHGRQFMLSRNNPDYICEGFFKTKNNEIDYTAFLTANRDAYSIVNMRLFNLKYGRTILIAPQKDGSLRSMQIQSPIFSNEEIKGYIDKILKQDDIKAFFLSKNNI